MSDTKAPPGATAALPKKAYRVPSMQTRAVLVPDLFRPSPGEGDPFGPGRPPVPVQGA